MTLALEKTSSQLVRRPPLRSLPHEAEVDGNGFAYRKASAAEVFRMDLRHRAHYHLSIADDHIELIEGNGHTKVVAFRLLVLIPSTAHEI